MIFNRLEGQLHPGKMMQNLWKYARQIGVDIVTGIEVERVEPGASGVSIQTAEGYRFSGAKVLLATNGFTRRLYSALAVQPARNQVLLTPAIPGLKFKGCFHYDRGYFYFRNVGDRILLGGGRHLAIEEEQTDKFGHTEHIQNALLDLLRNTIIPGVPFEIEHWWSGILGVGDQKVPIIEEVEENIFVAVRLGGMGVAIGTLVGEQAAQLLQNT